MNGDGDDRQPGGGGEPGAHRTARDEREWEQRGDSRPTHKHLCNVQTGEPWKSPAYH
jgi:hypothetical protein